ncbi:MAG: hypothetical protein IJZ19_00805 [Lentisphaeria bacterium]|nr:hypothetical protein [Lentisphaeria bacterium]
MKLKLTSLFALTAACLFGAPETTVDWSKVAVSQNDKGQIRFFSGKRHHGYVRDWSNKNLGKAEIRDGFLILDATGYKDSKTYAMIYLNAKKYPDQMVQIEFDIAGNEDGMKVDFYFTGSLTNKKHYWKKHILTVTKNMQHIVLRQKLPNDLAFLTFRFDFLSSGIYKIGNIKYGVAELKKVDGSVNHIPNGGAERGFYCVMPPTPKRFVGLMKVTRDSEVKHSGKYSFRLDAVKNSYNRLVLNSVPYVSGQPASFSAWMRAEKPTRVELMMFACSGSAYIKDFMIGKDWKKYTLTIPEFGKKKVPGVLTVGAPDLMPAQHINPAITLSFKEADTIWIDDLAFQLNTETTEQTPSVYISGRLNEPRGYYRQGEAITASMRFEPSGSLKTAELEYELVDWRGQPLIPVRKEKIFLPMKKDFTFKVPEHALGPMNLKFRVISGKEVMTHNFYCGVISREPVFNKRVGANVTLRAREGVELTANLLKDFGVGAVRAWAHHPGAKHLDILREKGFYVLLCLPFPHGKKNFNEKAQLFLPLNYTDYLDQLKKDIDIYYRNNVDIYEIFNEPNIWSGRSKNPDPAKYRDATPDAVVEGTLKISDFLKKYEPNVSIAGPGCCGTSSAYIGSYLAKGADKAVQAVTEHPYRYLPEQPDYQEDLKALKKVAKGKEIQSTESGARTFGSFPNNEIQPFAVTGAAQDLRLMIIGLANGVSRFYQFTAGGHEVQNAWEIFMGSGPEENNSWQPGVWLYAARTFASLLKENAKASPLRLGFDYRCYIFDDGKERVAALWKWFGKPVELVFKTPVPYLDMMGNPFTKKTIRLDHCPIYIKSEKSLAELGKMIRSAIPVSEDEAPVKVTTDVSDADTFTVNLKNLTIRTLSGEVSLSTGESRKFDDLKEEAVLKIPFRVQNRITAQPQKIALTVKVGKHVLKQDVALKAILVPKTEKKITVDGNLDDWKQYSTVKLDQRNAVQLTPWNEEDLKSKAEVRFAWDQEKLYVAVIAEKKGFFPDQYLSPWNGDGLQIALDTMRNADNQTIKYQDDDFEYAVWQKAGKAQVSRHQASNASYDSLPKSLGLTDDVAVAIKNQGDRTIYEMAFSPVSISPFKLFQGSACRFNLILNMNNGKQRIGWLEISPGIGKMPKRPGIFPDLILEK